MNTGKNRRGTRRKALKNKNTGKGAEKILETIFLFNERHSNGAVRLEKVDPPTFMAGKGKHRRIGYKKNPYLDFIGSYYGRMIHIECKDIDRESLPINVKSGDGIKDSQVESIRRWVNAQCLVAVVWFRRGDYRWTTGSQVLDAVSLSVRSIGWNTFRKCDNPNRLLRDISDNHHSQMSACTVRMTTTLPDDDPLEAPGHGGAIADHPKA